MSYLFLNPRARSTCFYKAKPVSFEGFSYGRKTLLRAHYCGQAGYYGYLCTRLPTSLRGQALVNKQYIFYLRWVQFTFLNTFTDKTYENSRTFVGAHHVFYGAHHVYSISSNMFIQFWGKQVAWRFFPGVVSLLPQVFLWVLCFSSCI